MEISVRKTEKKWKINREVAKRLRDLKIYGRVKFMIKEVVSCPKEGDISPINCLICPYYLRRVKGKIYCNYNKQAEYK